MSLSDFKILAKLGMFFHGKFEIMENFVVGHGTYSDVYKVMRRQDNVEYAIKRVKIGNMGKNEQQNALNEVQVLSKINSPYIISYKEAFIEDSVL